MRLSHLFASTLLAFTACASDATIDGELPIEGDTAGLAKADAVTIAITELPNANVGMTRLNKGGTFVITSKSAWKKIMGTEAPADVDFKHEWVAFFGTGSKNTGGYSAQIASVAVYPNAGALVLETKDTSPGNDCLVTQAFTNPHHVVKFAIPSPRPTFALASTDSKVVKCGPSNADRLVELADSRVAFDAAKAKHDNSYTYTRDFSSFFGNFSSQTTIVVAKGVVVERHFKQQSNAGGDATVWSEMGAEVGSHDQGAPAVTVDALYDECAATTLTKNEDTNWINFSTDANQFLQSCTFTPMSCQDDCTRGPSISTLQF